MARLPERQVCQVCGIDDDEFVSWQVEGPGLWRYTCTNPAHELHSWLTTGRAPLSTGGHDGLAAQLGIDQDLLDCFTPGEPYLEYGVVEYRYAVANPAPYKELVGLYSHTGFGEPVGYSASAFIGAALGRLGREGLLLRRNGIPTTGFWTYDHKLPVWALPPEPIGSEIVTWQSYAEGLGLDPTVWPRSLLS